MKKTYIFLLLCCVPFLNLSAQDNCSEANSLIVYALSHAESALDANNVTHAKHFAERSREAFERVQSALSNCQCEEVDDIVYDAIRYLTKARKSEALEDAYFYANKGKFFAEATIEKLDLCTVTTDTYEPVVEEEADALTAIEAEQNKLKQQQLELERKQAVLQQKLAEKQEQELSLKKEELIAKLAQTVSTNVKTFNEALKACDCSKETLRASLKKQHLKTQSLETIKGSAITVIKELTSNYMQQLADCDREDDED